MCIDFLVPEKYARVIDSQRCYSHATANAISYFCKCVKEAWGKGILAGAFYGYQFFTMDAGAAHFEPHKLFTDENIDFLAGPCAYDFNKNSGNANMIRYVAESCRLNGKLYLCEMDQGFAGWNMRIKGPYVCENEAEYASIMKRNIMENIVIENVVACTCEGTVDVKGGRRSVIWVEKGLDVTGLSIVNVHRDEHTYPTALFKLDEGAMVKNLRLRDIYQKSYLDAPVEFIKIEGEIDGKIEENLIND